MSQQSRRHDPYPWTWEIPLGIVLVMLVVLVCGVHLGRGIANVWAGAGWAFPRRVELFRSLPAVLRGDAAAGLDGLNGPVSSPSAVWTWAVATEVMLLAVGVWLSKLVLDRWGPGRPRGMASRGEAERLLGVTRLRKVRSVVRPDLYRKNRDANRRTTCVSEGFCHRTGLTRRRCCSRDVRRPPFITSTLLPAAPTAPQ